MASGYGLSRALEGAAHGLRAGLDRREQEKEYARRDVEWEQGQEERDYQLQRRDIETERADREYAQQEKMRARFQAGNDALREFMLSGDLKGVNEFLNQYSPSGMEHEIIKNPDGTFTGTIDYKGKKVKKPITVDDIGKGLQLYMTTNPYEKFEQMQALEREAETKKGDRQHDIAKIDREWKHRKELEGMKLDADKEAAAAGDGKGPSLERARHDLAWQKELGDLAKEDYGTLFGDQWKFDTTQEKSMRAAQSNLSGVYYRLMKPGQEDTNAAHQAALKQMRKYLAQAQNQADDELDRGELDKKQYDNRVADLIDFQVDAEIASLTPKPADARSEGKSNEAPESHKQMLRDNPTEKMKRFFDEEYGPGAADEVLKQSKAKTTTDDTTADATTDFSLVREAQAGETTGEQEAEKTPEQRLQRREVRDRAKMSRKQHGQIALSEYQNEWKTMDDAEKLEWWQENSGALKSRSKRMHKKAAAEIAEIRAAQGRGRNK